MHHRYVKIASFLALAFVASCDDIFIKDISDESIVLVAPEDSVFTQSVDQIFIWEKLDAVLDYQVIISSGAVVADTITANTSIKMQLDTGVYKWCVRGLSGDYKTALSCRTIEIGEKKPIDITAEVVELITPLNNTKTEETKQVFFWESVPGATQYQLVIASPSLASPTDGVLSKVLTTTTFTTDLDPGKYEWCVKAFNRDYKTENSCYFLEVEEDNTGG